MAQEDDELDPVEDPGTVEATPASEAIANKLAEIAGALTSMEERITQSIVDNENSLSSLLRVNKQAVDEVKNDVAALSLESRTGVASLQGMSTELSRKADDHFERQGQRLDSLGSELSEVVDSGLETLTNNINAKVDAVSARLSESTQSIEELIEGRSAVLQNEFTLVKGELAQIKEKASSLFVAYSEMVGEISRLATEAAQDFSKTLLQATELQQVVENCQSVITIFDDLKGSYETIASIAAEGLKTVVERKWMGPVEAAKDASVAIAALVNAFRTTKQERRDSRFDF